VLVVPGAVETIVVLVVMVEAGWIEIEMLVYVMELAGNVVVYVVV
jgi:hypothetical protein